MNISKRILAIMLTLMMIFSFIACSGVTPESPTEIPGTTATDTEGVNDMNLEPVSFETVDKHKEETVAGGYKIDMGDIVQVYFQNHPEWVELYNKSWELHKDHIQRIPAATNPERPYYVDEAFSGDIFLWDTVFMMLYDRYGMNQFPILTSMENFYYCQTDSDGKDNGYIPREIIESSGEDYWKSYTSETATNPPLLSWAEWECYQIHGDVSRFSKIIDGKTIYQRLCEHYEFIEKNKKLFIDGLYGKTNGLGTGLDDSPNQGSGQTYNSLSIQQAQNAYYISLIANAMGNTKDSEYYKSEHQRIAKLINKKMWDEKESMYSNLIGGSIHTNISTPTSLWALVGRVATKETAEKMVRNQALNSNKLYRPNGLATLAYDHSEFVAEGGYWKGAIWAPTSYQYIKGLNAYGYDIEAFEESIRLVNTLSAVYESGKKGGYVKKATLFENYSAEYIRSGWVRPDFELTRDDFAGWTPCMSIGLMIENLIGVTIAAPENKVNWNVNLTEHHSISNLYYSYEGTANRVSLAAAQRSIADDDLVFSVKADHPFKLTVTASGVTKEYDIEAGIHTYRHTSNNKNSENKPSLSVSSSSFDVSKNCFAKEALDNSLDYVYFTSSVNESVKDGISYQAGKLSGKIFNLNTVGRPVYSNSDLLTVKNNSALVSLGLNGAKTLGKYYYTMGNEGFMLCSEASKEMRTLRIAVSVSGGAKGIISASLSDASASTVSLKLDEGDYVIEIPYCAASEGRYLLVKWTLDNESLRLDSSKIEDKSMSVGISAVVLEETK